MIIATQRKLCDDNHKLRARAKIQETYEQEEVVYPCGIRINSGGRESEASHLGAAGFRRDPQMT